MGTEQDQLKAEIDRTRAELGSNVDTLTDRVSPSRVVERRMQSARDAARGVRSTVMGAPSSAASELQGMGGSATSTVRQKAAGNPLAAGLVAFGGAWLVSSLIPSSQREQQLASDTKDFAQDHAEPIKQEVQRAVSEGASGLKDQAQSAAQSVKQTATDAADRVKESATQAVQPPRPRRTL